jgi:hypothetical protein
MLRSYRVALAAPLLLLACSTSLGPANLGTAPANLNVLDGEWVGTYRADVAHGRSGALMFRLNAAEDVAQGCAIMRVGGRDTVEGSPMEGDLWSHVPPERLLLIVFNRGEEGGIRASFAPYPDPVCGCEMKTVLTGRVRGNVMEGTYVMEHASGGERMLGTWRVARRGAS